MRLDRSLNASLANPQKALIELDQIDSAGSLARFIRLAWHVLEPGQPYVHGWHIDAIAEHLEAVTSGQISRLLINVPPGSLKSLSTSVFWPAWEWGPKMRPHYRIIAASHGLELAIRDNMRTRRLVKSEWYRERWPIELTADQDQKTKFENADGGLRQATAAAGMTGYRGDRVVIDDPHSVEGAASKADRTRVLRWFTETVPTRLNNPDRSAIVVIMQRLHEEDVSGLILERELGYVHLCLPMEFEPEHRCHTGIGFVDPRTDPGELLFPERFPRDVVERDKVVLGEYGYAGQYQQRPAPRGGGMFPVDRFDIVDFAPAPASIAKSMRFWDKAGTKDGGAFTVGALVHVLTDGRICIADVRRRQLGALEREVLIKQTAQLDGRRVKIGVEQEPGSGGLESAQATVRSLSGWTVELDRPTGDKATRAEPYAAQVQAGQVMIVRADWNRAFLDEHEMFPNGKYKDQVDAVSAAFNLLTLRQERRGGQVTVMGLY